jgi:hypothetical protein
MNKYLEKIAELSDDSALGIVMDLTHKHFDSSMKPDHAFFPKNRQTKAATTIAAQRLVAAIESRFGKIKPGDHHKLTTPRKVAEYFKNDTP